MVMDTLGKVNMIRVKICGIRNVSDMEMVSRLGADAIGLLVGQKHHSEDFINIQTAQEILQKCPPFVSSVLVTHLDTAKDIIDLVSQVLMGLSTLQIHSECPVEDVIQIKKTFPTLKIVKNLHVIHGNKQQLIHLISEYFSCVDAFLLDSINVLENRVGGTGKIHDWDLSSEIVSSSAKPIILAGGLNPENISSAIKHVRPFAVDVNSGLKNSHGFKDPFKVSEFIKKSKFID